MTDDREVVPPPTDLEKQLKWFNLVLLVAMIVYAITNYTSLPDEIPIHFNGRGDADDWGSKGMIFLLPGLCIFLFVMMNVIGNLKPSTYNFPVKLTEENARRQVELARQMMQALNQQRSGMLINLSRTLHMLQYPTQMQSRKIESNRKSDPEELAEEKTRRVRRHSTNEPHRWPHRIRKTICGNIQCPWFQGC